MKNTKVGVLRIVTLADDWSNQVAEECRSSPLQNHCIYGTIRKRMLKIGNQQIILNILTEKT